MNEEYCKLLIDELRKENAELKQRIDFEKNLITSEDIIKCWTKDLEEIAEMKAKIKQLKHNNRFSDSIDMIEYNGTFAEELK